MHGAPVSSLLNAFVTVNQFWLERHMISLQGSLIPFQATGCGGDVISVIDEADLAMVMIQKVFCGSETSIVFIRYNGRHLLILYKAVQKNSWDFLQRRWRFDGTMVHCGINDAFDLSPQ